MLDDSDPGVGLSPPTRGNLVRAEQNGAREGSIPAHAGEPFAQVSLNRPLGVYPRPRGGTNPPVGGGMSFCGLSPPTRGNQPSGMLAGSLARSIPAHAGEP